MRDEILSWFFYRFFSSGRYIASELKYLLFDFHSPPFFLFGFSMLAQALFAPFCGNYNDLNFVENLFSILYKISVNCKQLFITLSNLKEIILKN